MPYNNKALLKWSAFRVERSEDKQRPYNLVKTPLIELVKVSGYEKFKARFNWLYNNYSAQNYELVWSELQAFNAQRIQKCFQDNAIEIADARMQKQVENIVAHFGEIPQWIEKLTDNQRQLRLDRAFTCYGLKPEEVVLETKQVYTIPQQIIKEYTTVSKANKAFQIETPSGKYTKKVLRNNEIVEVKYNVIELDEVTKSIYYSQEELYKTHSQINYYNDVVGRFKFYSKKLQRLAENAVIRDASWMAKFNDTEFDLREHREVEDTTEHNKMVPITDMQGPDSPYGLEIEFRDFLEPIYESNEE